MAEEQIVTVLQEIRDLQTTHLELYRDALNNQRISMELQKSAFRRQRIALGMVAAFFIVVLFILVNGQHWRPF